MVNTGTGAEIGAATGIEFLGKRAALAAAEPVRRGGGSALALRGHHHHRGLGDRGAHARRAMPHR
jgi:hypothetical protein